MCMHAFVCVHTCMCMFSETTFISHVEKENKFPCNLQLYCVCYTTFWTHSCDIVSHTSHSTLALCVSVEHRMEPNRSDRPTQRRLRARLWHHWWQEHWRCRQDHTTRGSGRQGQYKHTHTSVSLGTPGASSFPSTRILPAAVALKCQAH